MPRWNQFTHFVGYLMRSSWCYNSICAGKKKRLSLAQTRLETELKILYKESLKPDGNKDSILQQVTLIDNSDTLC